MRGTLIVGIEVGISIRDLNLDKTGLVHNIMSKSVERYERFVEKTEQEGKDMAARNLSILHITD